MERKDERSKGLDELPGLTDGEDTTKTPHRTVPRKMVAIRGLATRGV